MLNLSPYVILDDQYLDLDSMIAWIHALQNIPVGIYQLRMKEATKTKVAHVATVLLPIIKAQQSQLIINDDVETAIRTGAQGVHLGQDDGDVTAARRRLGNHAVIGLSVQTVSQLQAIPDGIVDYIGVGPIFPTSSKRDAVSPIGLSLLQDICALSRLPVVAIGGIAPQHLLVLKAAGVATVIMIQALMSSAHPAQLLQHVHNQFLKEA